MAAYEADTYFTLSLPISSMRQAVRRKSDSQPEPSLMELESAAQISSVRGLVHPHTDRLTHYDQLLERRSKYMDFIEGAAKDPNCALVFVGTAKPDISKKLDSLSPELITGLTEKLPDTSEAGRMQLAADLTKAGVTIPKGGEYGYMDELNLIYRAKKAVPKERFFYMESQVNVDSVQRELGMRVDPDSVKATFTGEKKEVCVRDNAGAFAKALKIPAERVRLE